MKRWRLSILAGVPVLAALFSLAMGKDANWDFLNYRWYVPYALLHGRLTSDVLVAGHATFYNPLLELPFYLIATHLPAMLAGFLVALVAALPFVPLCLLAEKTLRIENETRRFQVAVGIALSGLLGGGVLGQIGIVSWDLPLATLTFSALYVLLRGPLTARSLIFAGLLAGAAAGLKLTAAIYPLGIAVALLFGLSGGVRQRLQRTALFSIGGAIGMALLGGYWMWRLQTAFGNPLFPYFNDLFHSPFATPGGNRDGTFLPHDTLTALAFPFLFSANSLRVAEYHFRDVHIALAYVAVVVAGLVRLIRLPLPVGEAERLSAQRLGFPVRGSSAGSPSPAVLSHSAKDSASPTGRGSLWFLFTFAAVSFAAWEYMFAIYRYILPLEMLSPLLIVLALRSLPVPRRWTNWGAIGLLIAAQCLISVGWNRKPWAGDYVAVQLPYAIAPTATVIVATALPMGYVVPSLPPSVPVLRLHSPLAPDTRFEQILPERIAAAQGPLYVLFAPGEALSTRLILADFNLTADFPKCGQVTSNVADPLQLCPVNRE